ncbi:hypothetical protein [uncultured Hymenobacter sp.]|uniref:hypothetical protein n=1 Tax=uncultured Hymenobacter sp. TaxID=170016 RepID=UPI0035CB7FFF
MTTNPWLALPNQAPFVLPQDAPFLDVHDAIRNPRPTAYRLHLPPLPFQGRPDAPVVLLGLNPGYAESDETLQTTPYFLETNFRNYRHDPTLPYPLFFLDPAIEGGVPGAGQQWWHRRLKPLRAHYDDRLLARAILNVQYAPYRSTSYQPTRQCLPTQEYGFALVRQATERKALIIGLRSKRLWEAAVPELINYKRFYPVSSPRTPVLSEKQLGSEGYVELRAEFDKLR